LTQPRQRERSRSSTRSRNPPKKRSLRPLASPSNPSEAPVQRSGAYGIADSAITAADSPISEAGANRGDRRAHPFFRCPGRGRRALRREAILFLRLFTRSPLRPFSRLARRLASLQHPPHLLYRARDSRSLPSSDSKRFTSLSQVPMKFMRLSAYNTVRPGSQENFSPGVF
jgi:hypothetical protein